MALGYDVFLRNDGEQGVSRNFLYLLLNFAVSLKLLQKIKPTVFF